MGDAGESGEYISENKRIHKQALRELKGETLGSGGADAPDTLVDLQVVVGGQQGDGGVQRWVVEDSVWDLVFHETFRHWFRFDLQSLV